MGERPWRWSTFSSWHSNPGRCASPSEVWQREVCWGHRLRCVRFWMEFPLTPLGRGRVGGGEGALWSDFCGIWRKNTIDVQLCVKKKKNSLEHNRPLLDESSIFLPQFQSFSVRYLSSTCNSLPGNRISQNDSCYVLFWLQFSAGDKLSVATGPRENGGLFGCCLG